MARRRALIVGVDQYANYPGLKGCVNDALLVRSVLKSDLGFPNRDIRVLVDERATKDAILYRLESMIRTANEGDILFFYFAGHGSQIRDRDGDELVDYLDEIICPFDMDWDTRTFIVDDELFELFSLIPGGVLFEAILDTCFWGAGVSDSLGPTLGREFAQIRFLPPPLDIAARAEGDEGELDVHAIAAPFRSDEAFLSLWAACGEGDSAAEINIGGRTNGVFTYLGFQRVEALIDAIETGRLSRMELLEDLRDAIAEAGYTQVPELAASRGLEDEPPFGPTAYE